MARSFYVGTTKLVFYSVWFCYQYDALVISLLLYLFYSHSHNVTLFVRHNLLNNLIFNKNTKSVSCNSHDTMKYYDVFLYNVTSFFIILVSRFRKHFPNIWCYHSMHVKLFLYYFEVIEHAISRVGLLITSANVCLIKSSHLFPLSKFNGKNKYILNISCKHSRCSHWSSSPNTMVC